MASVRLPIGTQVVARVGVTADDGSPREAGAVGVVVAIDDALGPTQEPTYWVRFPDGREAAYTRDGLIVRAEAQWSPPGAEAHLWDRVILSSVIGSQAYGLATEASDVDRRGAYLAPSELDWSLRGAPEQLQSEERQACYWEALKKLLTLALKANPNALECLYSPLIEVAMPEGEALLAIRSAFLSKVIYATYNGYALSQFKKMNADRRSDHAVNWKHAMHLIRALMCGVTALRDGYLPLHVGDQRDALLAIKRGEVGWDEVERWRLSLHRDFDRAVAETRLPERPDYETVERFLIETRQQSVAMSMTAMSMDEARRAGGG